MLLEAGADPNVADERDHTQLHVCKSSELMAALLRAGANPGVADDNGNTPLHLCKSAELASSLLAHGANVNVTNKVRQLGTARSILQHYNLISLPLITTHSDAGVRALADSPRTR